MVKSSNPDCLSSIHNPSASFRNSQFSTSQHQFSLIHNFPSSTVLLIQKIQNDCQFVLQMKMSTIKLVFLIEQPFYKNHLQQRRKQKQKKIMSEIDATMLQSVAFRQQTALPPLVPVISLFSSYHSLSIAKLSQAPALAEAEFSLISILTGHPPTTQPPNHPTTHRRTRSFLPHTLILGLREHT